jgi:polyisoprenoid-binding protein YceI
MKKIVITLLLALPLFAINLELKSGSVAAHTEMMMDSTIDPKNDALKADISINNNDITTIKGKFWVEMGLFKSDKSDRDKSMYKDVEADKFKLATYTVSSVKKAEGQDSYIIDGVLSFHGKEKQLSAKAKITTIDGSLSINATSMILMSDFGIKMPCMVFMCVRDKVDLLIDAKF